MPHTTDDCKQGPTLEYIKESIGDLKTSSKRTADAMETIAAQGVMVMTLKERVDEHKAHFENIFPRLLQVELRNAKEDGAEEVNGKIEKKEENKQNFWDQVKANLAPWILSTVCMAIYIIDRLDIAQKLSKIWKDMCG